MAKRTSWRLALAAFVLLSAGGCATEAVESPSWRGPRLSHQQQLIREAEAFMAEYARRLRAGDRAWIAGLYHPDGAILVRSGRRTHATHPEIVARYRDRWGPPASFDWRDLHFEAAGPDAVVVLGKFEWRDAQGTFFGTYNALLARQGGELRIRIEDEAEDPSSRPAA